MEVAGAAINIATVLQLSLVPALEASPLRVTLCHPLHEQRQTHYPKSTATGLWQCFPRTSFMLPLPHKAIARNIGHLSMLFVVISGFGAIGYLFFGEPDSAELSLEKPSSVLKVATDNTVRPVMREAIGGAADSVENNGDGYDGEDYRE